MNSNFPQREPDDDALEEILRATPQSSLPPAWRAGILRAARPPAWPWLPRPVRWALAACWAAIAFFQFTAPPGPPPSAPGTYAAPPRRMPADFDQLWLADSDLTLTPPPAP